MSTSGPRVTARELALLVALAAYGLFPLVALLAHAASLHARFTGADGLIGADGVLGYTATGCFARILACAPSPSTPPG